MEDAQLVISDRAGSIPNSGHCSACKQRFQTTSSLLTDPELAESQLREAFEKHVKEKHSWRADANRTAALRLRKAMEDIDS